MEKYRFKSAVVLWQLKERGYSEASIQSYRRIFSSIENYLNEKGVVYSPALGEEMLALNEDAFFKEPGILLRSACIRKLNDVYLHGDIKTALLSPHKKYGRVELVEQFENAVTGFMDSVKDSFTMSQQENVRRRVCLFFRYMQTSGVNCIEAISYQKISAYHEELKYLKPASRIVEESSIHQILRYLSDRGEISPGIYLHMYLLEKGHSMALEMFTFEERQKIEELRLESVHFSSDMFLKDGMELVRKYHSVGYVQAECTAVKRTILYLFLFLDLNGLGYLPEIADIWLYSDVTKKVITGSSWKLARRVVNVFRDLVLGGKVDFSKVYRKGMSGIDELPEWCRIPLMDYAALRYKEKLEESTVNNDLYSILRFMRFILQAGISSFAELRGNDVAEFNLKDIHGSPEGKNSCNARIRKFLMYLEREGYTAVKNLFMSLSTTAATIETIVKIFSDEEILAIRQYVNSAQTPLEIRDSAMILLGCDMGIRGCDIVNLALSDIDWHRQCIRFRQDKTDADIYLAMPTAVGNAIYRYLRDIRNKKTSSDKVFISIKAPYKSIKRSVCYDTLHRILPDRNVHGSGFHVTRKTFSTNRLKSGVKPSLIADVLGHADMSTLTPYLSLDTERMSLCPLSLSELFITMEGGFR